MRLITPDEITNLSENITSPEEAQVRPGGYWLSQLYDRMDGKGKNGAKLPWSKTHHLIQLRPGEVSIWAGVNGHGKSLILSQVMLNCIFQKQTVIIASPEMPPVATLERMVHQAFGYSTPRKDVVANFTNMMLFSENSGLWLYDQMGTIRPDVLLAVIRYCAMKIKAQHFVVDSLMKCGINADDYNRQKWFIDNLCAIAQDTGIHIHLVAHSRKRDNEKSVMDKFDVKGTSEITDMPDNVFTVHRNKKKEIEARKKEPDPKIMDGPDTVINTDKQRHGDWEGMIALWFHKDSGQFVAGPNKPPIPYMEKYADQRENC